MYFNTIGIIKLNIISLQGFATSNSLIQSYRIVCRIALA